MSAVSMILQILSILASGFGLVFGIIRIFQGHWLITQLFIIFFSLLLLLAELYAFSFMKYFGFLFKLWGKALIFIFLGAFWYSTSGFLMWLMIIYWALAVIYLLLAFLLDSTSAPMFQGNSVELDVKTNDYFA